MESYNDSPGQIGDLTTAQLRLGHASSCMVSSMAFFFLLLCSYTIDLTK